MNKYQEALDRLKSIDLDILLGKLDYDVACDVSVYGIHDYPMLEMDGDIKTIQELVDKETPKKVLVENDTDSACDGDYSFTYGYSIFSCPNCKEVLYDENEGGYIQISSIKFCYHCGQKLDWSEIDE